MGTGRERLIMATKNFPPGIHRCGLPEEHVSCPGCGRVHGYKNRKVCASCEECSACCRCQEPEMIMAEAMVDRIMERG